jgi:hypothetical protein
MDKQFGHEITDQEAQAVTGGTGQALSYNIAIGPGGGCAPKLQVFASIAVGPGGGCAPKTQQLNSLVVWHMS